MSKTGYVYNIMDYTTLLAYFKIKKNISIPGPAGYSYKCALHLRIIKITYNRTAQPC